MWFFRVIIENKILMNIFVDVFLCKFMIRFLRYSFVNEVSGLNLCIYFRFLVLLLNCF